MDGDRREWPGDRQEGTPGEELRRTVTRAARAGAGAHEPGGPLCDPSGPRSGLSPPLLWCSSPAAVIYGWARPDDLGRITNDGSITLQRK